ncbi:unnamed protein product [Sphenostylis stenocarpa]|uniref:Uncharacterized protein n=1 Tax=Sphenostylis stenocarpa TaxID=92480 RepID=A0AA87B687_9FABA|nr:unnamed protein product [Sphenostylis stenocarpa]
MLSKKEKWKKVLVAWNVHRCGFYTWHGLSVWTSTGGVKNAAPRRVCVAFLKTKFDIGRLAKWRFCLRF